MLRVSACIEMLFTDRPLVDRVDAAAAAGCQGVELWGLQGKDGERICRRARALGLEVVACAADAPLAHPERRTENVALLSAAISAAGALGVPHLIVRAGQAPHIAPDRGEEAVAAALDAAAARAEEAGVRLLLESENSLIDHPGAFVDRSDRAVRIVTRVGAPAVGLLYDIYHAQVMEGNIIHTLRRIAPLVGHVHAAAVPGRTEPGGGELAFPAITAALAASGYGGFIGLEFRPSGGAPGSGTAVRAALAALQAPT